MSAAARLPRASVGSNETSQLAPRHMQAKWAGRAAGRRSFSSPFRGPPLCSSLEISSNLNAPDRSGRAWCYVSAKYEPLKCCIRSPSGRRLGARLAAGRSRYALRFQKMSPKRQPAGQPARRFRRPRCGVSSRRRAAWHLFAATNEGAGAGRARRGGRKKLSSIFEPPTGLLRVCFEKTCRPLELAPRAPSTRRLPVKRTSGQARWMGAPAPVAGAQMD